MATWTHTVPAPAVQMGLPRPLPSISSYTKVDLMIVGPTRGAAECTYDAGLAVAFKSMPEAFAVSRDHANNMWTFNLDCMDAVVARLKAASASLTIMGVPPWVQKAFRPALASEEEVMQRLARMPAETWAELRDFQQQGVEFGVQHGGRLLLADEMGVGKTCQAICIAACYAENWPLLIVCPKSVLRVWPVELARWLPKDIAPAAEHLSIITTGKDWEKKLTSAVEAVHKRIVVTTIDLVKKLDPRRARQYKTIIIDESHGLKSRDSQRTRFLAPVLQAATRVILLSGTPIDGKPVQAFSQVDAVRPGLLGSFINFAARYCAPTRNPHKFFMEYNGKEKLPEFNAILETNVLLRRLKKDVMNLLPKLRSRVEVEVDPDLAEELEEKRSAMQAIPPEWDAPQLFRERNLALNAFQLVSGLVKVKAAQQHVQALLDAGSKVLVFAYHHEVIDAIHAKLESCGTCRVVRIDGRVNAVNRQAAVAAFQTEPACRVAVISIKTAVGMTLSTANVAVFAEFSWQPTELVQAEDRAHRMGQTRQVQVHYLHATGTWADIAWPVLIRKLNVTGEILEGGRHGSATGLQFNARAKALQPSPCSDGVGSPCSLAQADGPATPPPHASKAAGTSSAPPVDAGTAPLKRRRLTKASRHSHSTAAPPEDAISTEQEIPNSCRMPSAGLAGDGQPVARRLARALGAAAAGGSQERIDLTGDDHDHTVVKADPGIAPGRKRKLPGSLRR